MVRAVVCTGDLVPRQGRCATCTRLSPITGMTPSVLDTLSRAVGGKALGPKDVKGAADKTHAVFEVDLGWMRTAVVAMVPNELVPDRVERHSLFSR